MSKQAQLSGGISSARRQSSATYLKLSALLLRSLLLMMMAATVTAAVIKVPDDQSSIQAAINAASSGDVIWVAQGTYQENLTLKAGVSLEGGWKSDFSARNWTAWASIVDGNASGSVVVGASGAKLDGFTLRNGQATNGGGIRVENAAMTIRNNTVEDNKASGAGGGIYISASPKAPPYTDIGNNLIRRNEVGTVAGGLGGGIHVTRSATGIRITGNTIGGAAGDGNKATWGGAGIYVEQTPIIQIEQNTISHNSVDKGHGGGVMIVDGTPNATLGENLIEYNSSTAGNLGGGVYSIGGTFISRNRIGKNSLFNPLSMGGGIAVDSFEGTPPRIENNFLYANQADKGGGIYLVRGQNLILMNNSIASNKEDKPNAGGGVYVASAASCILQNNILWGNGDDLYQEVAGACTLSNNDIEDGDNAGQDGNITANPLFVAYDDLHIGSGSPAIDSGRSAAAPSVDIDGDVRGSKVDIGADERPSEGGTPCPLVKSAQASYLEPHIDAVRAFRDRHLTTNLIGRVVADGYYAVSPTIGVVIDSYPVLKTAVRIAVTPLVYAIAYPTAAVVALVAALALLMVRVRRRNKDY